MDDGRERTPLLIVSVDEPGVRPVNADLPDLPPTVPSGVVREEDRRPVCGEPWRLVQLQYGRGARGRDRLEVKVLISPDRHVEYGE